MKRYLLFTLVIGMFAVQADADMYNLDPVEARLLREMFFTDAGNLGLVIDAPGTAGSTISYTDGTVPFDTYGTTMQGAVGYVGQIGEDPDDGDVLASLSIGASGATLGIAGSYDGYSAWIANDDDDTWSVRLLAEVSGGGFIYSSWATLSPGDQVTLAIPFALTDFSTNLDGLGFEIQGSFDGAEGSPSNPDFFHISVVPVPGAILLGILGMGVAGLKLRKFA